jgi:hypothetical protein
MMEYIHLKNIRPPVENPEEIEKELLESMNWTKKSSSLFLWMSRLNGPVIGINDECRMTPN